MYMEKLSCTYTRKTPLLENEHNGFGSEQNGFGTEQNV
jgi:hypothetical protein